MAVNSFRKWAVVIGLCLIAVGAWPAYQRTAYVYHIGNAKTQVDSWEFAAARESLRKALNVRRESPEAEFLLAVVTRRQGDVKRSEMHLERAGRLGWPDAELDLQRLLMKAQVGSFLDAEPELKRVVGEGQLDDGTAVQIYEALANGYWRNYRLEDAMRALDFWVEWRPKDVAPRLLRAQIFSEVEDPESAEKEYRAVLQSNPNHQVALESLGGLMLRRGNIDEASRLFEACLSLHPGSFVSALGLSECQFRQSHVSEARDWLNKIDRAELQPADEARVLNMQASIDRLDGKTADAARALEKAIELWPHDGGLHRALAQCYSALGQREQAQEFLRRYQEMEARMKRFEELRRMVIAAPDNAELQFELGQIVALQGLDDEAANWWRSAVRIDPLHQPSHEALAYYYELRRDPTLVARFRALARDSLPATFQRAWYALSRNEIPRAKALDKLLEPYPEVAPQHALLQAAFQVKEGKLAEAEAQLTPLVASPVLRPLALTLQAELLIAKNQPLAAERLLQEARRLDENNVNAHRWLAVLYYDLGAAEQAQEHLRRVAELDAGDYRAPRLMALMNKDYENYQAAIAHYQVALSWNPPPETRAELLLELAECLVRQREFAQALKVLQAAPPSTARNVREAECHYNLGERGTALKLVDEALAQAPDNFDALLLRGDIALVDNQPEQAAEYLERAVRLQPHDHQVRFRWSQALARVGKADDAQREQKRSEELKALRAKFAKLHEQAIDEPKNGAVRREIAVIAKELGREDLAQVWTKAADALATGQATDKGATEKPATEKPATEKPATEKPATEKPATEKPATEKPATEKPATEKPATEKPADKP